MRRGAYFRVGNGESINPWIPWRQGKTIILKEGLVKNEVNRVADLIDPSTGMWKNDLLITLL